MDYCESRRIAGIGFILLVMKTKDIKGFDMFYQNIRRHDNKFFNYYRMTQKSFDEMLEVLRPSISKKNTVFRNAITAEARLTITLRYLSTGCTFSSLQYEFFIERPTVGGIVRGTCQAIWTYLKDVEMPEPAEDMWLDISNKFWSKMNVPNCVGSVDEKHVRCINPVRGGSNLFNYKKFFSVILIAVADSNLRVVAIGVGAYGKEGDCTFKFTITRCLPNTRGNPQPFIMVGDKAFKLSTNLLRPYPAYELDERKRVFNHRLSRCRLYFWAPVQPDFIDDIVRRRDGINYDDTETHPFMDVNDLGRGERGQGLHIRDNFSKYLVGTGAITFQRNYMY
ncbi:hypothetical protein PR048_024786 [Dryococelus australis]|uniref:DDE Tnp4 domain-containing protein n=1 Tax=Dryococelus australis TaxID=614101 RepID=A0ABQ9GPH8_9NEOP|nr:hypothetical protein PR048_024786 [Dryococelus australis]